MISPECQRLDVHRRPLRSQRQSIIDFDSIRRWFVRKAADALDNGAQGFSVWTIAEVVPHAVENARLDRFKLPLGLITGRYAGDASGGCHAACVKLPR